MDTIQQDKYQRQKCKKHPTQDILFVNVGAVQDNNDHDNLYYCEYCSSEDVLTPHTDILSIKQIIEAGENSIVQKWPPVNNYLILRELAQVASHNQNKDSIDSRITDCFTHLKEQVIQEIDSFQKKVTKRIQDSLLEFDQTLEGYQEISKIDQLRSILIENQQNNQSKTQQLKDIITKMQSERDQNSKNLEKLLNKGKCQEDLFNGRSINVLKESIIQYIQKLDMFIFTENNKINTNELNPLEQSKNYKSREDKERELRKLFSETVRALASFTDYRKFDQTYVIKNMIQSTYESSKDIEIVKHQNVISMIPRNPNIAGQVFSEQKIDQDLIYEFIIGFKHKPAFYICLGFEEEEYKNRYLGNKGTNSFIVGQENHLFCSKLVKGNKNLQFICQSEFVDTLLIQVKLSENKFYIADYPNKRAVNCMDTAQYQFQKDKDYYFTIEFHRQQIQVDLISSKIIDEFTII